MPRLRDVQNRGRSRSVHNRQGKVGSGQGPVRFKAREPGFKWIQVGIQVGSSEVKCLLSRVLESSEVKRSQVPFVESAGVK